MSLASFAQHNVLRFIQLCALLICFYCYIVFHWLNISQFIYCFINEHLSCFQVLPVMNKTPMNILLNVFFWTFTLLYILDIYLGVGLMDHRLEIHLALVDYQFSRMVPVYTLPAMSGSFNYLHQLLPLLVSLVIVMLVGML